MSLFPHSTEPTAAKRAILVIDDSSLRMESFAAAEKILNKIDKLEASIINFQERDQKLFGEWFSLTFREMHRHIEEKKAEHTQLINFHNSVIAMARIKNISLPAAYRRLKQEEKAYARANESVRRKIDEEREARKAFLREEMEREAREEAEFFRESRAAYEAEERERYARKDAPLTPDEREELEDIKALSDEMLRSALADSDLAMPFLEAALLFARNPEDYSFFVKIWSYASISVQEQFSNYFESLTGQPLGDKLRETRERFGIETDSAAFEESISPSPANTPPPPEEEKLKLIYRKLVRRLHPDMRGLASTGRLLPWQQRLWAMAQDAYKAKNVASLEHLYRVTLLRLKELNDLTVAEIRAGHEWLAHELEQLAADSRGMKKQLAWGFHKKRNYTSLEKKIRRGLGQSLDEVESEIYNLQAYFEALGRSH